LTLSMHGGQGWRLYCLDASSYKEYKLQPVGGVLVSVDPACCNGLPPVLQDNSLSLLYTCLGL